LAELFGTSQRVQGDRPLKSKPELLTSTNTENNAPQNITTALAPTLSNVTDVLSGDFLFWSIHRDFGQSSTGLVGLQIVRLRA
jgi:hypothetical protein